MRSPLRRALLIGVPAPGLDVVFAIERLSPLLRAAGFAVDRCVGEQATRAGILDRLEDLVRGCGSGDAYLIYYFGHGGRVRFTDIEQRQEVFGFVTCHEKAGFEAVLDRELSDALTRLDAGCGNVTAILDCCYSGELVRARRVSLDVGERPAPKWARDVLESSPAATLALDSHPRIVRLGGASPKRQAFALVRGGRTMGVLTEAFIETIETVEAVEATDEGWRRLSWAAAIHRIRERVFERLRFEGQWPALVGPRNRLMFSTELADIPGTVSFVPTVAPRGRLRAGWHQGVSVGDRWGVAATCLGEDGRLRLLAEGMIESVECNRAVWKLERGEFPADVGLPAYPLDGLDDRGRLRALERVLAGRASDPCPVRWTWSLVGGAELPHTGAVLHAGDRVQVTLEYPSHHDAPPHSWFVSVILVEADGRPRLLSARMPEGIELRPGEMEVLGVRSGRRDQGFELTWPAGAEVDQARLSLLFLASRRPMELGHIVPEQPVNEFEALEFQGLAGPRTRASEPELAADCAWGTIEFGLRAT
jgi:hypothetical protein